MNKIVVILIIAVIVLIAGAYFFFQAEVDSPVADNAALIKEAYSEGGSAVCDIVDPGHEGMEEQELTIYIKDGKLRFVVEMSDQFLGDVVGNAIVKNRIVYSWNEGDNMGIKMEIEEEEEDLFFPFIVEDEEGNAVIDEDFKVDCRRQSIDDEMFELPENVEFQDMADMWDIEIDDPELQWEEDFEITPEMMEGLEDFDEVEGLEELEHLLE